MRPYLLLTPGPLTTTETVKEAMMSDWCTWDEDYNVGVVENIRRRLVELATSRPDEYTAVLMQGSGTFCVEATLGSVVRPADRLLVAANGAYGKRMGVIAEYYRLQCHVMRFDETEAVDPAKIDAYLTEHEDVTHVSVVHCETTTGVLNPLSEIAAVVKRHGKTLIVDAMSSFGGVPIDMAGLGIDFMISSANKCIQGVPGFGFIIARRSLLELCKGVARSLSLDLYDQWAAMEQGRGKWRFTSPTHVVRAFMQALAELEAEGGRGSPPRPLCREPPHARERNARSGLQDAAARRGAVAGDNLFLLSVGRLRLQGFLHRPEDQGIRDLSRKNIAGRHLPHRQHRRRVPAGLRPPDGSCQGDRLLI